MQIQAFPIYTTKTEQFRYNPKLQGYANYHLYAPNNAFLPFLIYKATDNGLIDCIRILNEQDQEVEIIMGNELPYQYFRTETYDYFFYYGEPITHLDLPCGKYYLEFSISNYKRYSELFTVSDTLDQLIPITWSCTKSVEYLTYQTGWKQKVYLDAELTEPEYSPDIDDSEDGYGVSRINFGKVDKVVKLKNSDVIPEYLVDALSLLPIHNQVEIGPYQKAQQPSIKPDWKINGTLATIEIEFAESTAFMTGCENITLTPVDISDYTPLGLYCGNPTTDAAWLGTGNSRCQQIEIPDPVYAWRVKESTAYCVKE